MGSKHPLWVRLAMDMIKAFSLVYNLITKPYYYFTINPKRIRNERKSIRAQPAVENDPSSPYRFVDSYLSVQFPGCATLDDVLRRAVKLWPYKDILGTRELLKEEIEIQNNGREFKKFTYGDYHWENYQQIDKRVDNVGHGLLALEIPRKSHIAIFAETRAEWTIVAHACFRYNYPLVTLYSTLGDDAIVHGINESEVSCIITTDSLIVKLVKLQPKLSKVKHIIYLNDGVFGGSSRLRTESQAFIDASDLKYDSQVEIHALTSVEYIGQRSRMGDSDPLDPHLKPKANDLAVIMYTSGSTGAPKGVEMTHGNLMTSVCGLLQRVPVKSDDIYMAYLPAAHVLELSCEIGCLLSGIPIGFSSPLTFTDSSSKIKKGTKGDAAVLKPTVMVCVPVIMDRITKTVWEKVSEGGPLGRALFEWAFDSKLNWLFRGYPSPLSDRMIFKKIRDILGGRVRLVLCGGAPLSEESQSFFEVVFCPIMQGYGLTETCASGTMMELGSVLTNNVGPPIRCCQIRLREWTEGKYSPMDKPHPRGEIIIGGENITRGYYKQPEKTDEDFFTDEKGVRWFCTGDIGQFNADGTLRIIDRKKDLVKLQTGEYISLGKVELALTSCPLVETVCIYGESSKNFVVCLMVPKQKQLMQLAKELNVQETDFSRVCEDTKIVAQVLKHLHNAAASHHLHRTEYPQALRLLPDPWLPESGLVTAALKLKRKEIENRFRKELDSMLGSK